MEQTIGLMNGKKINRIIKINNMKRTLLTCACLLLMLNAGAKVVLPKIFSDGMVMQRNTNANLWGTAGIGRMVKVKPSWTAKIYSVKADAEGKWKLSVKTPDAGGPYQLTFNDGTETTLKDIMMGEVWICSGQSNMEMPMRGFRHQFVDNADEDILHSNDPLLRSFTVKEVGGIAPADTVAGSWQKACPATVCNLSATAYYFGRELREILNVPVGLVVTCWGGSTCEAWMAGDWLKAFPEIKLPTSQSQLVHPNLIPTALYNGMLHPLLGLSMRGVIWYQGEANVTRYQSYSRLFSTLIKGWRTQWGEGDFPFYYCQIAPFGYPYNKPIYNSAFLREQQSKVETMVPNTGMAVLLDAGLEHAVHPRKKYVAGHRLALLALENTYGIRGITSRSTCFKDAVFRNDTVIVSFSRSRMGVTGKNGFKSDLFEVAGEDRHFYPAKAWLVQEKMYVKSDSVSKPVSVRYAFKNYVEGDLYSDNLPVSSFRSDEW